MAAIRNRLFVHILRIIRANILQIARDLVSFREGICII